MITTVVAIALAAAGAWWWFAPRSQERAQSLAGHAATGVRLSRRRQARRHRDEIARQAPVAIDLIAALLESGASAELAIATVADTSGGATGEVLQHVALALRLGCDPVQAWSLLAEHEALESLAAAMVRSARSGAPLTGVLLRAADDARRDQERRVQIAARSAGVRSVGPLAACFLPAFLLLGVVPVVASLAGDMF